MEGETFYGDFMVKLVSGDRLKKVWTMICFYFVSGVLLSDQMWCWGVLGRSSMALLSSSMC